MINPIITKMVFCLVCCSFLLEGVKSFQPAVSATSAASAPKILQLVAPTRKRSPKSFSLLFLAQGDDNIENDVARTTTTTKSFDSSSYGFDSPPEEDTPVQQEPQQSDRLRKSLDESAKFKIRNDARFTWLSTFLVSASYTYGCLGGSDGQDFLDILGIPSGGLAGGLAGIAFALGSIFLFFAPELFAKKR